MDFKKIKAIEKANKEKWVKHFGAITDESGIYILTREENGFKFGYVGQAKHILTRLAEHLVGWQHIDRSLKTHGLFGCENPNGWVLEMAIRYPLSELDKKEQEHIKYYANLGYQMRNKTAGGQGCGKVEIAETRPKKTYRDGVQQGYINAQREVQKLFEKNLVFEINGKTNKNKEKSLQRFNDFLNKNLQKEGVRNE